MQGDQDIFLDYQKKTLLRNNNILYRKSDIPETDIRTLNIQLISQFTFLEFRRALRG